ncbi:hypothetical protein GF312_14530 [Candidatus Poribacteria bacterium]|nr:hypothetical protein [Candidatus Poribacteria bacterium]
MFIKERLMYKTYISNSLKLIIIIISIGGILIMSSSEAVEIKLPDPQPWPAVACSPEELQRLRDAYKNDGLEHKVVAKKVEQGDKALKHKVDFPPEGGQHNQWYQCDKCQIALETIDETHHRCPNCEEVYTGYPYDNVIYSRRHSALTRNMEACAWAYALTEDEKYAQRVRDIMVRYAERYSDYPYHSANMGKKTDNPSRSGGHVFEQTLNEASWMLSVCNSYDLTRLSEVYSKADHKAIRENFLLKVYENIAKHKAGKSNWQTYHNSAFMLIGGVLNKAELIRQALEDEQNGFYYQMKVSVLPGGMWYENSWGYHFYTLGAVQRITETARRLGIDLYSVPQVKDMYTVAMDYQMADGTLPRFGDATTTGIPGRLYEAAYNHWNEPVFLSVLPEPPTWDSILYGRTENPDSAASKPQLTSTLKEGAGHAILQSNGDKGRSSAVMTFGPFGGFHGHFDKLSFVYFGMDMELGYDPGRARSQAYRLPVHRNWYRATTSHNTVLVDRTSQQGVAGKYDLFVTNSRVSAAAAYTNDAYGDVTHHRLIVLRPDFLVVFDMLKSNHEHTFDWIYHNLGKDISCPAALQADDVPEGQGFEYIQDIKTGITDKTIKAVVLMDETRVEIMVNAEADSGVMTGTGVGESIKHRVPLIFVTRKGKETKYAAVIEPVMEGQEGKIQDIKITDIGIVVEMKNGDMELYSYSPEGVSRNIEGINTESKLLCLYKKAGQKYEVMTESED